MESSTSTYYEEQPDEQPEEQPGCNCTNSTIIVEKDCKEDDEKTSKKLKRLTLSAFAFSIIALACTVAFAFAYTLNKSTRTTSGYTFFFFYLISIIISWVLWSFGYKYTNSYGQATFIINILSSFLWSFQLFLKI